MKKYLRRYLPLAFITIIVLVNACGQKGPLYLPELSNEQAKQTETEQNKQEKKDKGSE